MCCEPLRHKGTEACNGFIYDYIFSVNFFSVCTKQNSSSSLRLIGISEALKCITTKYAAHLLCIAL